MVADSPSDALRLGPLLAQALGTVRVHTGDHAQAEQSFLRALALRPRLRDDDSLGRADLHNNLGNLQLRRGDLAAAEG
ncbi:MAG: tetratricopeptide repeat protein [Gemmatimonadetes bacterium]|nr:tetratricopeptide repeat protein [Gemmatimonadota bacterium]